MKKKKAIFDIVLTDNYGYMLGCCPPGYMWCESCDQYEDTPFIPENRAPISYQLWELIKHEYPEAENPYLHWLEVGSPHLSRGEK